ncbi:recombination-associated protein RdgC [Achromobacter sp. GG226]|uniref:recombination-associated protein RdgC n=1 Tax=Verticiella alkaliphila TaxID=2779529 RepID=UPI001C0C15EA|nr:recombination-associated protein RdgC [Verticiella sp. GG226]MBU4611818.1 recombination-associated protein RdgC [Verticiella sp. GG226]
MWFKNLQIYRLANPFDKDPAKLEDALAPLAFVPGNSLEPLRHGWVPPRENGPLVHSVGGHFLIAHRAEKKLLPASVINQFAKAKAQEIEEQQGFKPGRKQMKEIKEQVTDELMPRAFSIWRDTRIWIDPVGGLLVIDASGSAKCDEVMQLLNKSVDRLGARPVQTELSPVSAMTSWLAADEAPAGFTVDEDTELRSTAQSKATVRYVRQAVDAEDVQRHIASGKQCTRLALTWSDRVSFVLSENLGIKRVAALDVLKENTDSGATDEAERFDADFALMTGELTRMLQDVFDALGGEKKEALAA